MVVVCPTLLATQLTTMSLDIIVHNILPWCTATAGYRASNNNVTASNNQPEATNKISNNQPEATNKQANATMHNSIDKSENHH